MYNAQSSSGRVSYKYYVENISTYTYAIQYQSVSPHICAYKYANKIVVAEASTKPRYPTT